MLEKVVEATLKIKMSRLETFVEFQAKQIS